jgi:hypothetical protein
MQPGCFPWGAIRAAILVPPSASRMFIILAGVGAGPSRRSTFRAGSWVTLSHGIRGRGRSLAPRALVDDGCRHLQCVGSVGLAPGGPSCQRAGVAPCTRVDHPRCRAPLGRRSCSGVALPLHWDGAFT